MSTAVDHARHSVDVADPSPRFVAVRANLMPDEIVAGRRTVGIRRRALIGLGALVVVLALAFGFSWWETHSASGDLDAARNEQTSLQAQTKQYAPLVQAKANTASIEQQLHRLMAGDLSWHGMLMTLRSHAPSGVALTQVTGSVQIGAAAEGSTGGADDSLEALNRSGRDVVGPLTITGTAKDKRAVAAFADSLATVKGIASPLVTNVSRADGTTTFSISALITTDALGGRYTHAGGN